MNRFIVAVIDGSKARLLTLEPVESPESESGPNLVEHGEVFNPAKEMAAQDLWAAAKTGRNRGRGSQGHNYDDHRSTHLLEFERRFANAIAEQLLFLVQTRQTRNLILVAEPQILGVMRDCMNGPTTRQLNIQALSKDLCHLKPHELHEYLSQKKLLPARQRALGVR